MAGSKGPLTGPPRRSRRPRRPPRFRSAGLRSFRLMPTHRACRAVRLLSRFLLAVLLLSGVTRVAAQPGLDHNLPTPILNSVLPAGGKVGTSVEVTFAGANTEEPDKLVF